MVSGLSGTRASARCGDYVEIAVGFAVDITVGHAMDIAVGLPWGCRGVAVELAVNIAVDIAVGLAVEIIVGHAVDIGHGVCRGACHGYAEGLAVGFGVGFGVGPAMVYHGVSVAYRAPCQQLWNLRSVPWVLAWYVPGVAVVLAMEVVPWFAMENTRAFLGISPTVSGGIRDCPGVP